MTEQSTQGQAVENTEEQIVIDPFAGDDTEPVGYVKLEVRREEAIAKARELLGDSADTATFEEAVIALREDGHSFYVTMKGSPRQQRKFRKDFAATQPQAPSASKRLSKAFGLKDDLAASREALAVARKATDQDSLFAELRKVQALADAMIAKVESGEIVADDGDEDTDED